MADHYHFQHFRSLVQRFLQEFNFISGLQPDARQKISETILATSVKAGHVLWRQGALPDDGCFLILAGEVQIWQLPKEGIEAPERPELVEGSAILKRHARGILTLLERDGAPVETVEKKKQKKNRKQTDTIDNRKIEVHVKSLGIGMLFGEIALLENQPRGATCICKSECKLLHIKKADFDRILKSSLNQLRFKQLSGPMRQFLREFEFYTKLEKEVQDRVPEIMHYQRFKAGSLIFKQGDAPDCVYISLTGQVNIFKTGLDQTDACESADVQDWAHKGLRVKLKAAAMLTRLHEKSEYSLQDPWVAAEDAVVGDLGAMVCKLGPGTIFGELALVDNVPRTASVVCAVDCEFLVVAKDDFTNILMTAVASGHVNAVCPELIGPLLQTTPFFSNFQPAVQDCAAYSMRYAVEPKGQVVFWEDDPPGCCYLIISGTVGVWKKASEECMQVKKLSEVVTAKKEACLHCDRVTERLAEMKKPQHFLDLIGARHAAIVKEHANIEDIRRHGGNAYEGMESTAELADVLGLYIATLGKGVVFGEQALLDDAPRNATITCEDTCHFLVLSREDFDRVIKQDHLRNKVKKLGGAIKRLLREFDIFKDLSHSVQDQLADAIHYYKASERTLLFEQGDPPNHCYILLSGEVTVWKRRKEGQAGKIADISVEGGGEPPSGEESPTSAPAVSKRPPVELESALAGERCAGLAALLSAFAANGMSTFSGAAIGAGPQDDTMIQCTNEPVASLGAGALFGELALLNDQPRGATISCFKESELLVIEKDDFDRILKDEMTKAKDDKLMFLTQHVPGVRSLPGTIVHKASVLNRLQYYFHKVTVPKNHVFIRQGSVLHGDLFFVWQGSVESYSHLANGGFRRTGILLRGSIFGEVPVNQPAPFTVVATSSPCEVLHITTESQKHIPESVMASIKESMDQLVARRMVQCASLMPMTPEVHSMRALPGSPQSKSRMRKPPVSCLMPSSSGLFRRNVTAVDYKVFELDPGETMAMKALRPRHRGKIKQGFPTMTESASAPSLAWPAPPSTAGSERMGRTA